MHLEKHSCIYKNEDAQSVQFLKDKTERLFDLLYVPYFSSEFL